jgi:hypothetical protein
MHRPIAVAVLAVSSFGCATAPDGISTSAGWICSADGLKAAEYGGGNVASIQLQSDSQGRVYTVRRINETTAQGTTQNGTSFVCRRGTAQ